MINSEHRILIRSWIEQHEKEIKKLDERIYFSYEDVKRFKRIKKDHQEHIAQLKIAIGKIKID